MCEFVIDRAHYLHGYIVFLNVVFFLFLIFTKENHTISLKIQRMKMN